MSHQTPCIGVCTLDQQKVCQGCFRHIDEIAAWSMLSAKQRQIVMRRLEERAMEAKHSRDQSYNGQAIVGG